MNFIVVGRGWGVGRGKTERPWPGSQTHFCRHFHFVVESETIQRSIQAKRTCHWVIKILVGEARQADHQQTGSQRPRPSASGLLTFSACLTQNGLSCFPNFSRIEILPISCIIWHGYFTWEEEEENIKKGVNIYRLVLCCSVRFLNVVLQKRAVTRLVKELPTCGGVSQDCGIFFGRFSGQQFNSYKKQSETWMFKKISRRTFSFLMI